MANVGLKSFLYGELTESSSGNTYAAPTKLAGAIEIKDSADVNEAVIYADDELAESDYSVASGTLTLGIDDDDNSVFGPLLGKTSTSVTVGSNDNAETTTQYASASSDIGKYAGFGYVKRKIVGGVEKFCVVFYPKVKFKPFTSDGKTQGEKLEFTTPSVEGKYFNLAGVGYKIEADFESQANAITHLKSLFTAAAA